MPRMRNDEAFQEQRRRIAAAAASVFAAKGFHGATNRDIARAAGVSPGLIYWYFEGKEELFVAAFEHLSPRHAISFSPEAVAAMPVEEFFTLVAARLLANAARPEFQQAVRMLLDEVVRFPAISSSFEQLIIRPTKGLVSGYLERRIADGTFRPTDPGLAAQIFMGSLMGYVVRKHVLNHQDLRDVEDAELAASLSRIFVHGLLAGEPSARGGAHGAGGPG